MIRAGTKRDGPAPRPPSLARPAITGLVGSAGVVLGSSQGGSPFTVHATGAWFFAHSSSAPGGANIRFLGIMLVYAGIALMLGSWYEVTRTMRARPGTPVKALVPLLVAWELPVVLGAPLFSGDVYSYAAQGRMVARRINPYVHGPSALGGGPFLRLVDPLWLHARAPYGPAWERLSGWIVQWSGHDVLGAVVGFRLVALAGVTLVAWAVPTLARSVGRDPSTAFALAVLNPLVVLVLLGGSHNDALMLGLLVAGCALARRNHVLAGLVLCSLAAEVKIPALVGVVFIGWWWKAGADGRERVVRVGVALAIAVAVMVAVGAVAGLGWRWVDGLSDPGTVVSWLDPATAVGLLVSQAAHGLGFGDHQRGIVQGARAAALFGATLLSIRLLVRSERDRVWAAMGWSLLAFVVLGPVVWPWYETWSFVFLAVAAEGWVLALLFVFSAVACVADIPHPGLLVAGNAVLVSLTWAGLVAVIGLFAVTRLGPRRSSDDDVVGDAARPLDALPGTDGERVDVGSAHRESPPPRPVAFRE